MPAQAKISEVFSPFQSVRENWVEPVAGQPVATGLRELAQRALGIDQLPGAQANPINGRRLPGNPFAFWQGEAGDTGFARTTVALPEQL